MTKWILILLAAPLVSGCVELSADGGMNEVASGVARQAGAALGGDVVKIGSAEQAQQVRERVDALLAEPLTADSAVQISLLNNRTLQAAYNDLGLSETAYVEASLPSNPVISATRIVGSGIPNFANFEFRLVENILDLITLPRRTRIAADRFAQSQQRTIEAILRLAAETRRSQVRAVAAQQQVSFLDRARAATDAAVRLNAQLGEVGGGDQLSQAQLAAFYAELSVQVGQARLTARKEREKLTRLMGLWGGQVAFKLPAQLPTLPAEPDTTEVVEIEAITRRVDLGIARREVEALAKSLELTNATRYVSFLQLAGIFRHTDIDRIGPQIDFQVPIFDAGKTRQRAATETYMRALNRLVAKAVDARSEARIAAEIYRGTYDIARFYRDRVLPLRQLVSKEIELRYSNAIQPAPEARVDLFSYLADQRIRIGAEAAAVDARRDFYLAAVDLQAALTFGLGPAAPWAPGN